MSVEGRGRGGVRGYGQLSVGCSNRSIVARQSNCYESDGAEGAEGGGGGGCGGQEGWQVDRAEVPRWWWW